MCAAIRGGARDVGALAESCGAGSGCGGCWSALESLLAGDGEKGLVTAGGAPR